MFLNHTADFARFQPAFKAPSRTVPGCTLHAATLVETPKGWRTAASLRSGDSLATLDGGFAPITALSQTQAASDMWLVPGGALDNCSDVVLQADQHVALNDPACLAMSDAPYLMVPVKAFAGYRGIAKLPDAGPVDQIDLRFADEEVIYAQTGLLIHAARGTDADFFARLGYGETRAALNLINGGLCAPDKAAA